MKTVFWLLAILSLSFVRDLKASAASPARTNGSHSSMSPARFTVALTFDDGPSNATVQVLSVLRAFHIHATFFAVGSLVRARPSIVGQIVREGNIVGNHTYTHADLEWLDDQEILWQLHSTQAAIQAAARITPRWFRPPYDAMNARIQNLANKCGLETALWSIDPRDWARPGRETIVSRVLSAVRPGSVVLLHDGGGDRTQTLEALPIIIRELKARDYRFVTLNDIGLSPPHRPVISK